MQLRLLATMHRCYAFSFACVVTWYVNVGLRTSSGGLFYRDVFAGLLF